MLSTFPTEFVPLLFGVLAAIGAVAFRHRRRDEPNDLVSGILWAIAAGCVVISLALWLLP